MIYVLQALNYKTICLALLSAALHLPQIPFLHDDVDDNDRRHRRSSAKCCLLHRGGVFFHNIDVSFC